MKSGTSSNRADILPKEGSVSDVHLAADLLDEVIGSRGVREPIKSMLDRAYFELSKCNNAWTRRRVRAVFHKEALRIDHREIREMEAVIEARKKHAEYREETARRVAVALNRAAHSAGREGAHLGG